MIPAQLLAVVVICSLGIAPLEAADQPATNPVPAAAEKPQHLELGPFCIDLPEDMHPVKQRGVDSMVGTYANSTCSLMFDYGWYGDRLQYDQAPGFRQELITIDHQVCRVIICQIGNGWGTGLYVPRAGRSPGSDHINNLSIWITCRSEVQAHAMSQVLKTVQLTPRH